MSKYILAIDQGTTSTRVVLVDAYSLNFVDIHQIELPQHFPAPSFVEHDLNDIWNHTNECIKEVLVKSKVDHKSILGIGITNQRETTCAFNKQGNALAKAIVWQDKRTASFCAQYKADSEKLKMITGLPLDPYFSATKMQWLINNNEEVKKSFENATLRFGTIDTYLLYKLTDGVSYKTDATNASRTLLLDLKTCNWNNDLIKYFGLNSSCLPEVCATFSNFGVTKNLTILPDGIPILCMIGDQQSALLGQGCTQEGMSKCTYGTGAFFLLNTGKNIRFSNHGLLTTVAYKIDSEFCYALEGASFIAGAGVQWFRDQLKGIQSASQVEELAKSVASMDKIKNLFFFPFFSGIGSPYWKSEALACIYGMSRDTGLAEMALSLLDGLTQSITDLKESAEMDLKKIITSFHVDGGACKNNLLMQLQSNYLNVNVIRPKQVETTVLGASKGCLVTLKMKSLSDLSKESNDYLDRSFEPKSEDYVLHRRNKWKELIRRIYL